MWTSNTKQFLWRIPIPIEIGYQSMQENLVRGRAFDFDGGRGGGGMVGLVLVCENFFPQTFGDIIFFPDINNLLTM